MTMATTGDLHVLLIHRWVGSLTSGTHRLQRENSVVFSFSFLLPVLYKLFDGGGHLIKMENNWEREAGCLMIQIIIINVFIFRKGEKGQGGAEEEGEREPQPGSKPRMEPDLGRDLTTLRP